MQTLTATEGGALAAPMIYSLVTSLDTNGKPNALGVSWVTRTSFDPFLLLISIDHSRYSHAGIDFHKEFVVNYPNAEQTEAALSLIHISEPTRLLSISYAVFCLKK